MLGSIEQYKLSKNASKNMAHRSMFGTRLFIIGLLSKNNQSETIRSMRSFTELLAFFMYRGTAYVYDGFGLSIFRTRTNLICRLIQDVQYSFSYRFMGDFFLLNLKENISIISI